MQSKEKNCPVCARWFEAGTITCPDDGVLLLDADRLVGSVFDGKCEILSVIGQGGMSIVYKARQVDLERIVALKLLKTHLTSDENNIKRFQREAQAASLLVHPNINRIYSFGVTADGVPYLLLEYLDGISLARAIDSERPFPLKRAIDIFSQVADALSHAHGQGVIHRDLKPSNIVLIKDHNGLETAKVVDFGTAKFLPRSDKRRQQLTQAGEVVGTLAYMSPEQKVGGTVDARSDIYSLGYMLFEAVQDELKVPALLEPIVTRALDDEPAKRHQSAAEFKDELLHSAPSGSLAEMTPLKRKETTLNVVAYKRSSLTPVLLAIATFITGVLAGIAWFSTEEEERLKLIVQLQRAVGVGPAMIIATERQRAEHKAKSGDYKGAMRIYCEELIPQVEKLPPQDINMLADVLYAVGTASLDHDDRFRASEMEFRLNEKADELKTAGLGSQSEYFLLLGKKLAQSLNDRGSGHKKTWSIANQPKEVIEARALSDFHSAEALMKEGKLAGAENALQQARALLNTGGCANSYIYFSVLDALSVVYATSGRPNNAIAMFSYEMEKRKHLPDAAIYEGLLLSRTGTLQIVLGKLDEARANTQKALSKLESLPKDPRSEQVRIVSMLNLASIDRDQGRLKEAEAGFAKAMKENEALDEPSDVLNTNLGVLLADVQARQHNYKQADQTLRHAYETPLRIGQEKLSYHYADIFKRGAQVRLELAKHSLPANPDEQEMAGWLKH